MPGTAGKSSSTNNPRGSAEISENSRIITGFSNIAGYFDPLTAAGGALSASTRWTFTIMREPGTASGIVNFNAAGSDPIYGASTTNQPASVRSLCLIRFN
nr:MAG TPA: hypothetical protein [Caudoviricetes sp.]